ncbi:hypothetical protein [uncultured Chitinophaga sp.]|jgi:hypothetical protein|uniref:tetratricopeptide repeat protein n=1 Tax=uncultured Chitinophaga sp. TaxID=339340 RepID=UPI00260BBB03|nr:hypothetical protein [uncultured Chitinophaga sp.]
MKHLYLLLCCGMISVAGKGQLNCDAFTDSASVRGCRLYNYAITFYQGSRLNQQYLDSAVGVCPTLAEGWRALSVPYLKRGDFAAWRRYLDKAVALEPLKTLDVRGWCRFKFLRDYEGALQDLKRFDTLSGFAHRHTGDGTYSLYVVMALCERELGNYDAAARYFAKGIDSIFYMKGKDFIGLFDFLHRAVMKIRIGDYNGALADLEQEEKICKNYVEVAYYKGVVYRAMGKHQHAKEQFEAARRRCRDGFRMTDIYCEMHDAVYPADIDEALAQREL